MTYGADNEMSGVVSGAAKGVAGGLKGLPYGASPVGVAGASSG